MKHWLKPLSWLTCIGMFLVLLMGALVTKTESGEGCGRSFPLCHGKLLPEMTPESIIEYSHRLVTGLVGILLLVTFVAVWRYVKRTDARVYAVGTAFFTIVQSILGALAVIWPQTPEVMALHFGISLLAFAFTLLLALSLWDHDPELDPREDAERHRNRIRDVAGQVRHVRKLNALTWITMAVCYIVVYLGAFVRHTDSSGGCTGWPLCNGQLIPELSGASGIVFIHRVAALILVLMTLWLSIVAKRYAAHTDIAIFGGWALYLVVMQALSGAFVTYTLQPESLYILSAMIHVLIVTVLFGVLSSMCTNLVQFQYFAKTGSVEAKGRPLEA